MGRRDAVEVPRGRLGRPVGGAARRRDRDAGLREPALRAGRARAAARGAVRRGGRRAADRRRRRPRAAPARRRRRARAARATYTGAECHDWAGGRTGDGYAAQGNILVSAETVDALAETFEATAGRPLAERLLDCLAAAQAAGGDSRGQQSAALLVVERDGGYAGLSDVARRPPRRRPRAPDRGAAPPLRACTTRSSARRRARSGSTSTTRCAAELGERLARLGYEATSTRTLGGRREPRGARRRRSTQIDPVVLEQLRSDMS